MNKEELKQNVKTFDTPVKKDWDNLIDYVDEKTSETGNFIPLSGTEEGNPVTGLIKFGFIGDDYYGGIGLNPNNDSPSIMNNTNSQSVSYNGFVAYDSNLQAVNSIYASFENGFESTIDNSESDPTNKLIYAQRSYVEKPETLINALNNCDGTQLGIIKGILGIT